MGAATAKDKMHMTCGNVCVSTVRGSKGAGITYYKKLVGGQ